jgi:lipopolysaccharide export system permease protein
MDKYIDKPPVNTKRNVHVQISPGTFAYVESFNADRGIGYRFTLEKFDGVRMVYKLMANSIQRDTVNNKWIISNYYIRKIDSAGNQHLSHGLIEDTTIALKPTDLYKVKHRFDEMNLYELNNFIRVEKEKGSLVYKRFEIEKYKRIAGPAAIIILTFMGMALSSRKLRGGMGLQLGIGITLAFTYILMMQVTTVFSTQGNLSPAWGAWIPNFFFFAVAVYLVIKAPK